MGEELRKSCTAITTADAQQYWQTTLLPQNQNEPVSPLVLSEAEKLLGPVLTFENVLQFVFPLEWEEAELEYSVEFLTMNADQTLEYIPVELTEERLQATYSKNETDHVLTLQLGQKFAQPGTYRVRMVWSYEGICFIDTQTTLFANCSARSDAAQSG